MRLDRVGETALLDWIRKAALEKDKRKFLRENKKEKILLGIGDDAAAFRLSPGKTALASSDMMVEGVHFDTAYFTPYQLGFKIVSVNASDIFAMGGSPLMAVFSLAAPPEMEAGFIKRIFEGALDALAFYGARLGGGDLSASPPGVKKEFLVLDMCMIGEAGRIVKRSGARVGDGLFVTGPLGDSACGLALLKKMGGPIPLENEKMKNGEVTKVGRGLPWEAARPLLVRHLMPCAKRPPRRPPAAMIDVSDGLLLDASRLCRESGVGVKIYEDRIPVSAEMRRAAAALGLSPLDLAKSGGEDYELLYTARRNAGGDGILIGEVIPSGLFMVDATGKMKRFKPEGYKHFQE